MVVFVKSADGEIRTDCLRTGQRCISNYVNLDTGQLVPMIFENGQWTRNDETDNPCSSGGTEHVHTTGQYPLPQQPQDPITLLTGHGHEDTTGTACTGGDFEQKWIRRNGD